MLKSKIHQKSNTADLLPTSSTDEITQGVKQLSISESAASKTKQPAYRLFLGEANFTYTLAFVEKHPKLIPYILATEYDSKKSTVTKHGQKTQERIQKLRKTGVQLLFNVDATKLNEHPFLKDRHAHIIQFNAPYVQGRRDKTKTMIAKLFQSASQQFGDKIHVSLARCAETREDKPSEYNLSYQQDFGLYEAATNAGYEYINKRIIDVVRYSKYQHSTTQGGDESSNTKTLHEHVFIKTNKTQQEILQKAPFREGTYTNNYDVECVYEQCLPEMESDYDGSDDEFYDATQFNPTPLLQDAQDRLNELDKSHALRELDELNEGAIRIIERYYVSVAFLEQLSVEHLQVYIRLLNHPSTNENIATQHDILKLLHEEISFRSDNNLDISSKDTLSYFHKIYIARLNATSKNELFMQTFEQLQQEFEQQELNEQIIDGCRLCIFELLFSSEIIKNPNVKDLVVNLISDGFEAYGRSTSWNDADRIYDSLCTKQLSLIHYLGIDAITILQNKLETVKKNEQKQLYPQCKQEHWESFKYKLECTLVNGNEEEVTSNAMINPRIN